MSARAFAELVSPELFESLVEFHTPVCRTIAEVAGELARVRAHAVAAARGQGLQLGSAGTHPFSLFERQQITDRERYRRLADVLQYAARRELIFGMHVHAEASARAGRHPAGLRSRPLRFPSQQHLRAVRRRSEVAAG